jgi:hypothetical protein
LIELAVRQSVLGASQDFACCFAYNAV